MGLLLFDLYLYLTEVGSHEYMIQSGCRIRNLSHGHWAKASLQWAGGCLVLTNSTVQFHLKSCFSFDTELHHQGVQKLLCKLPGLPWSLNLKFKSLSNAWQLLLDRPEAWSVLRNCCPAQPHNLHRRELWVGTGWVPPTGWVLDCCAHLIHFDWTVARLRQDLTSLNPLNHLRILCPIVQQTQRCSIFTSWKLS